MTHPPLRPRQPSKSIAPWPPMAVLALISALGAAPGARAADAPANASAAASLTITFQGIKTTTGAVMAALVGGPEAYAGTAPPTDQRSLPVTGGAVSVTFQGLKPGTYAIRAFHDVNGDGKLNTNPFGIPTEPYAFSKNARGALGPPGWDAAAFEIKAGDNRQTIDID